MSYDKYTWTTGETITAEKLNHLENGVAEDSGGSSDILEVHVDTNTRAFDKTWEEVNEAYPNVIVYTLPTYKYSVVGVTDTHSSDGHYHVFVSFGESVSRFDTTSADGYPTMG